MNIVPYLRSQTALLADIEARVRDTANSRWSEVEIYNAINDALQTWQQRVRVPHLYTLSNGLSATDYEYALPAYIHPPIVVQVQRTHPTTIAIDLSDTTTYTWQDLPGWEYEPDGSGGMKLRLTYPPYDLDARVIWYAPNSRIPTTIPSTSGSTAADATALTLSSAVDCDETGYVFVGAEWMFYAGVTRAAGTITLNNLVRGLYGTTAALHNTSSACAWGVAAPTTALFAQLIDQAMANLHALFLVDGASKERGRHSENMMYYQQRADAYWARHISRAPRLLLGRDAMIR